MQIRILWEELLKRDLEIEVVAPPVRLYSNFIRGIRSLPVRDQDAPGSSRRPRRSACCSSHTSPAIETKS